MKITFSHLFSGIAFSIVIYTSVKYKLDSPSHSKLIIHKKKFVTIPYEILSLKYYYLIITTNLKENIIFYIKFLLVVLLYYERI